LAVGYFYDEGLGVGRSIPKAQLWYRRAYRAGNAAAAVNLGLLCKGRGDYAGARRWFRKALLSGDDDGALELAKTYVGKQATARAIPYLRVARRSKRVSEATREEATRLLESLQAVVRTDNGGRW
jgi:TPR repeat protein